MSSIKSAILLIYLLLGVSIYAQSKDTLLLAKGETFNFYVPNFTTINQTLSLKNFDFQKNLPTLSLYNKTTNMYDNYLNKGNGYMYSNSNFFFENKSNFFIDLFLGNNSFMQNNSLIQNNYFMLGDDSVYRIRDSFNPYGASNMRQALVGGVLGLLFN